MTLILDAGALNAYERGSRTVQAFLERAYRQSDDVRTTTAVVAQTWHGEARQVRLATLLRGVDERALTSDQAPRSAGCSVAPKPPTLSTGRLSTSPTMGDEILTGDPSDMGALAMTAGKTLIITRVP